MHSAGHRHNREVGHTGGTLRGHELVHFTWLHWRDDADPGNAGIAFHQRERRDEVVPLRSCDMIGHRVEAGRAAHGVAVDRGALPDALGRDLRQLLEAQCFKFLHLPVLRQRREQRDGRSHNAHHARYAQVELMEIREYQARKRQDRDEDLQIEQALIQRTTVKGTNAGDGLRDQANDQSKNRPRAARRSQQSAGQEDKWNSQEYHRHCVALHAGDPEQCPAGDENDGSQSKAPQRDPGPWRAPQRQQR